VIHEHGLGQARAAEGALQPFLHGFGARASGFFQGDDEAAMIVHHRKRTDRLLASLGTFEIHLPKLVRGWAFEALPSRRATVVRAHQPVAQQHAMQRDRGQHDSFVAQQQLQFARTPVGP
jgi:hypothetical protein